MEPNSLEAAPEIVGSDVLGRRQKPGRQVFAAREVRRSSTTTSINRAGIHTIDIIEWPYRYWHTADDLPQHCSAQSLEGVGKVVTGWLMLPRRRRAPIVENRHVKIASVPARVARHVQVKLDRPPYRL